MMVPGLRRYWLRAGFSKRILLSLPETAVALATMLLTLAMSAADAVFSRGLPSVIVELDVETWRFLVGIRATSFSPRAWPCDR